MQYLIFNPCWTSREGEKGLDNMLCIMALSTLNFFPTKGNVANLTIRLISFNKS